MADFDIDAIGGVDPNTVEERVRALARDGFSDHEIASLLRLHVRLVRRILQSHAADDQHQHEEIT
jgi:hypothetical protein